MNPILVTCYVNPDLDGIAGAIAYAEFLEKTGKHALTGIVGIPHEEAKYMLDRFKFEYPLKLKDTSEYNKIILIDASDTKSLEGKTDPDKVMGIIDHRRIHEVGKFPNATLQIEFVGAASTLVAEKFIQNNLEISTKSAILLLGAIISNTLNFKGTMTTQRDKDAANWLNKIARLPENFWKELFLSKSDLTGSKLSERIINDLSSFDFNNKKISIGQIEMIGGEELIKNRTEEILKILAKLKRKLILDYVFLSIIELEAGKNYFVTEDTQSKELLEKILNVKFINNVAQRSEMIMRKQIIPLIKTKLE